jgi:hypothetical protein
MGIAASIYFRTRDGHDPTLCDALPQGCDIGKADECACEGATHEVRQHWRYYGPGHERGPWPLIAAALMTLHASADVETVWYYGDCESGEDPFPPQQVQEFTAHYIRVGHRPYRRDNSGMGAT